MVQTFSKHSKIMQLDKTFSRAVFVYLSSPVTHTSLWDCNTRFLLLLLLCLVVLLVVSGHGFLPLFSPRTWWRRAAVFGFPFNLSMHSVNATTHCGAFSHTELSFYGSLGCLRPISDISPFPFLLTLALLTHTQLFPEVKQCIISGACGTHRKLKCTAFPHLLN